MPLFANRGLCIFVLIVVTSFSETDEFESKENVESFLNSLIQLKGVNDTFAQYAAQVQTLFCSEQPICGDVNEKNRNDVLRNLSLSMGYGYDETKAAAVSNSVGGCCPPCSCDEKTCKENGNCCLSQVFLDAVSVDGGDPIVHDDVSNTNGTFSGLLGNETKALYSECIKAVRKSYMDKNVLELEYDLTIPSYLMITQCFGNNASSLTIQKCNHPSGNEFEETVPVTSSDTRRIYWNTHCARCNNDDNNIVPWNSTVRFNFDIAYFLNRSHYQLYPEKQDDIIDYISKSGEIVFSPPFPIAEKVCILENILKTCSMTENIHDPATDGTETAWLREACDHIYSPIIFKSFWGRELPFRNIFCYLCQHQNIKLDIKQSEKRSCEFTSDRVKSSSRVITGLLNYRALTDYTGTDKVMGESDSGRSMDEQCGCNEIFDPNFVSTLFLPLQ